MSELTASQRAEIRQRLQTLRTDLQATLSGSTGAAGTVELDQSSVGRLSRMDAMQAQAMAKASAARAQYKLRLLDGAAARIEHADYGLCANCGELIAWPRLHANPAVLRCVDCETAREHGR